MVVGVYIHQLRRGQTTVELEGAETAGSEQVLPVEVAAGQTSEIPPLSAQHACPHALQQCVGVPASGKMVLPPRIGCEHG